MHFIEGEDIMIEVVNGSYYYGNNVGLKNINISIKKGDAIALIGPNGSGKSTFMKIINGLIILKDGKYVFDGNEINEKRMKDTSFSKTLHKRIGFVFQNSEIQLFCPTVYDEIAFGLRQMAMEENEVEKRTEDILEFLNIKTLKHRQPFHLSGGEKKKVAIASVLVLNPEVLVLDEPLNGLDPKTKKFISELLINLNNSGKTIICATHDFQYINDVFKRAIVFSQDHTIIKDDYYEAIIKDEDLLRNNNII